MSVTELPTSSAAALSSAVLYSDFTSAASYLASMRIDRLAEYGHTVPSWRAVEYRPRLPIGGLRSTDTARGVRGRELDAVQQLLHPDEEFEARLPDFLPNSQAAVAAYAESFEVGIADRARRLLFEAYWVDGRDIGRPEMLRDLLLGEFEQARASTDPPRLSGYVVSMAGSPVTTAAYRRVRDWQDAWLNLGSAIDLTLVTADAVTCGRSALDALSPRGLAAA